VALVRTDASEEPGASFIRVTKIGELGTTQAATSNQQPTHAAKKWRNNPEDTILHSHRRENLKSYSGKIVSPTHRPLLYSPETLFLCFWYSFLLEVE
jgi:hypothetical protein